MQELLSLIDKASKVCGSDTALAKKMGITQPDISHLRKGKRPFSPEIAAELADIAGEDAVQAAIDAIIIRSKGTRKEGAMRAILGKALAAGVAGMLVFSYSADSTYAMEKVAKTDVNVRGIYIVSSRILRKLQNSRFLGREILSVFVQLFGFAGWPRAARPCVRG